MRRVTKPFTVVVKGAGRRASAKTPSWPQLDDQPHVEWPETPVEAALEPEPAKPAGRILPALDETPRLPEPYRDPRRRPAKPEIPPAAAEINDPPASELAPVPVDAKAVAATIVLRQGGRKRLDRDAFGRGERWKARLPIAVHRAGKKLSQR